MGWCALLLSHDCILGDQGWVYGWTIIILIDKLIYICVKIDFIENGKIDKLFEFILQMKILKIRSQKLLLLSPIAQGDNHLKPDSFIFFIYSSLPSEINSQSVLLLLESLQHFFALCTQRIPPYCFNQQLT